MMGCKGRHASFVEKENVQPTKIVILPRPQCKPTSEGKEKDSMELDNLQFMIKYITNEIIDIKNNFGESTSTQCLCRPFFMRPMPPKPLEPLLAYLNIDLKGVTTKYLCNYHQESHSKKKNMFSMD
jgi:hypothetical protein